MKPDRVAQVLGVLGVSGAEYDDIVSLAHESKNQAWVATTLPERERQLSALIDFERNADKITTVAPLLMPGLLQEPAYIRAIMTAGGGVPESEVPTRISVRMGRRDIITRHNPVKFTALIGETVLHQRLGGPKTMADQLRHLLKIQEMANVQIRVVSFSADWNPALEGAFTLLESKRAKPIVQLENRKSTLFLHEAEDVLAYQQAVDELIPETLHVRDTNWVISRCIERWERK